MASHRVVATEKQDAYGGGHQRHIAALCPDDGPKVPKAIAIANIKSGRESYWTAADGQRANIEVVPRCSRFASEYPRTDRDTTLKDNLLSLVDC